MRMNFITHRLVIIVISVIAAKVSIGQNITIDPTKCYVSPLTICNPFLNGRQCGSNVLRTTHGAPSFYENDKSIQLNAAVSNNGTMYDEGFTLAYNFVHGTKYTVKVKHKGLPQTGAVIYPKLIVYLTNDPPRYDDGCGLAYLTSIKVISQVDLTVSSTTTTSSFEFTPTQDISYLWFRSKPVQNEEAGLLISSIEIVDASVVVPPPTDPAARCQGPSFDFCGYPWNGNFIFRVDQPLNLSCNAFKNESDRGVNFGRRFIGRDITLSDGFIASAYDYAQNTPWFQALAVNEPCRQAVRVAVSDTTKSISRNIRFDSDKNLVLYPSPSSGMVYISGDEQLLKKAKITVIDQLGRVILQQTSNNTAFPIKLNLQHVEAGLYFCQISVDNNTVVKKLMIKK